MFWILNLINQFNIVKKFVKNPTTLTFFFKEITILLFIKRK